MSRLRPLVHAIVARELALAPAQVTDRLGPGDVPAWDSIGHLQLVRAVERELGFVFTIDDVMAIGAVSDLVTLASRRLGTD